MFDITPWLVATLLWQLASINRFVHIAAPTLPPIQWLQNTPKTAILATIIVARWYSLAAAHHEASLFLAAAQWLALILKQVPQKALDRKSTRLNSSHVAISYAVLCLKKK